LSQINKLKNIIKKLENKGIPNKEAELIALNLYYSIKELIIHQRKGKAND
jgi:hypothetical protein